MPEQAIELALARRERYLSNPAAYSADVEL